MVMLTPMDDWNAISLTLRLAAVTTILLLVIGTPVAWWLATTRSRVKPVFEALTALPLVLPPTVIGFYLLLLFSPNSTLGGWWLQVTGTTLTFSFSGLVVASVIYSFPFVIQPLQGAFESVGESPVEAARTLGASRFDAFRSVVIPLSRRGFLTATVLGFAHTIGEFGVVLMVGGNIPGTTQVISIRIYSQVESLNYSQAHALSAGLIAFSFAVLLVVFTLNRKVPVRVG